MPKAKKHTITVSVTGFNVKKGICGDTNKCAIADAFVRNGFRAVSVGGGLVLGERLDDNNNVIGDFSTVFPLSKSAERLIDTFDRVDDHHTPSQRKAARKTLAAKLDAKPLKVTVKLSDVQAKHLLTKKAYTALSAVAA